MIDDIQILHVDDDPAFVDMTAEFLTHDTDCFTIETANSGADGLAQLSAAVDCVISDYDMPGMNGIEFLDAVREEYPELPFILFTGKGSEAVASEALTLGATDYLQKATGTDQYELLANRITRAVEQHRAEEELERKTDLLEKTQALTDVGAWEYNIETGTVYFTDKVYDIYGVDADFQPDPETDVDRFYHPDDREDVREAVSEAIENHEPYDIEVRIIRDAGTEKWVRTQAEPLIEDDSCRRIRGTIQDITERKERERSVAETKEWYQALLDGAPDAVFVADAETGEIRETNRAATRLLDRSRQEIIGLHQTDLHPHARTAEYADLFDQHVGAGEGRAEAFGEQVEIHVVDADGNEIPVEINAQTVEIDGEYYNQGYFRDITARKQRERELRRQTDRLDELVTVVSHDLRNLIRTLSASLDLLEAPDTEALERCDRTVDRMDGMVEDLVELARHGETELDPEPVSLRELSAECAQTAGLSNAALSTHTDATIVADRSRVRHLLENLFTNAKSHGGPDVSVTVGSLDDGFFVADDGTGIPESERERVFRVGYSTSPDGTGFGLNITKQVAETHGWDICVTDSDEGGARFEVTAVDIRSA
jgi:PAS domain S-box-containing protein